MGKEDHEVREIEVTECDNGRVLVKERRRKKRLWFPTGLGNTPRNRNALFIVSAWLVGFVVLALVGPRLYDLLLPEPRPDSPLEHMQHVSYALAEDGTIQVYRHDRKVKEISPGDKRYDVVMELLAEQGIRKREGSSGVQTVDAPDTPGPARKGKPREAQSEEWPPAYDANEHEQPFRAMDDAPHSGEDLR